MSSVQPLTVIAYSDYVCPWCYIGLKRIERLASLFVSSEAPFDSGRLEVEWRPFELHPETPRSGADLRGRLGSSARAEAYRRNILGLAEASGMRMRMPLVVANSHRALEAAEFAREHGGFAAYHPALFRAYFEDGRDSGDPDVLCDIAREAGVDDQGLRQALLDERYADAVDRSTAEARAMGILSTPTFVFDGGFQLVGAQDDAVFASIARRLLARRRAT